MKFAMYQTPDTNLQIRCIDGEFTCVNPGSYSRFIPATPAHWSAILNAPGIPATAEVIEKLRISGSLCTYTRSIAKMFYSVPDDVELYERGDFGIEAEDGAKTERLNIRVTPRMKAQLQAKAKAEKRTVSNYIETLIEKSLNEQT